MAFSLTPGPFVRPSPLRPLAMRPLPGEEGWTMRELLLEGIRAKISMADAAAAAPDGEAARVESRPGPQRKLPQEGYCSPR